MNTNLECVFHSTQISSYAFWFSHLSILHITYLKFSPFSLKPYPFQLTLFLEVEIIFYFTENIEVIWQVHTQSIGPIKENLISFTPKYSFIYQLKEECWKNVTSPFPKSSGSLKNSLSYLSYIFDPLVLHASGNSTYSLKLTNNFWTILSSWYVLSLLRILS